MAKTDEQIQWGVTSKLVALQQEIRSTVRLTCQAAVPATAEDAEKALMDRIQVYASWCILKGMLDGLDGRSEMTRHLPPPPGAGSDTRKARAREEQRAGGPWQVIEETYHKGKDGKIAPPDTKPIAGPFAEFGDAMAVQERLKAEREHEMEELHRRMYNKALPFWPWVRYRVRRARPDYASPFVGLTDERASYEASVRKMPDTARDYGLHMAPDVILSRKPADHAEADSFMPSKSFDFEEFTGMHPPMDENRVPTREQKPKTDA